MTLQNKWWKKGSDGKMCPSTKADTAESDDELSLSSLAGIFYILIGGLGLALIIAFVEFWWNSRKHAKKCQVRINLLTVNFGSRNECLASPFRL